VLPQAGAALDQQQVGTRGTGTEQDEDGGAAAAAARRPERIRHRHLPGTAGQPG
jgi:hypothetical protein